MPLADLLSPRRLMAMFEPGGEKSATARTIAEFARFLVIGTVGFVVDASTLKLVVWLFGINLYAGRILSFLTATTGNWMLNRRFTFKQARAASPFLQWLKYLAANGVGGAFNFGTFSALVYYQPFFHRHPTYAIAMGSIAGLFFNFTANKFFVFRHRPDKPEPEKQTPEKQNPEA